MPVCAERVWYGVGTLYHRSPRFQTLCVTVLQASLSRESLQLAPGETPDSVNYLTCCFCE